MRVLVTGASGFVGRHFVDVLLRTRPEAIAIGLVRPGTAGQQVGEAVEIIPCDIENASAVLRSMERVRPDVVVHLAAQSSPRLSFEDPEGTLRTNLLGLLHVLEAIRRLDLSARVLMVGSAEEYGLVTDDEMPLRETAALRPRSPYAVSKVAQEYLASQYVISHRLDVVMTRTFHHTGAGRGADFAESSFARQIAEIEAGLRPPLVEVGNVDATRDFTDVADVCRAYIALVEKGASGEAYNVCSGRGVRIGDILEDLRRMATVRFDVTVDPSRLRLADNPVVIGDPSKLKAATGWAPEVPFRRTLESLLQYWRDRTAAPARVLP